MRPRTKRRKYITYEYTELDGLKAYLEEMALKGWRLVDLTEFCHFEAMEPRRLTYAVEMFDKGLAHDSKAASATEEYIEYCRQAGWEHVCTDGYTYVFVSEAENPVPIETDEGQKFDFIVKSVRKRKRILLLVPFVCFFAFASNYFDFSYIIVSNFALLMIVLFMALAVGFSRQFVSYQLWRRRQKRRLAAGLPLESVPPDVFKRRVRRRRLWLWCSFLCLTGILLVTLLNKDYAGALYIIIFSAAGFIVWFIYSGYQKTERLWGRVWNLFWLMFLGYFLAAFVIGAISMLLFGNHNDPSAPPSDVWVVTTARSVLAARSEYTVTLSGGVTDTVDVVVFASPWRWIVDRYVADNGGANKTQQLDPAPWNAEAAFMTGPAKWDSSSNRAQSQWFIYNDRVIRLGLQYDGKVDDPADIAKIMHLAGVKK